MIAANVVPLNLTGGPIPILDRCAVATPDQQRLSARAAHLWPDSPALQAKWIRAVAVVRSTSRGWLLERPVSHV